MFNSKAKLSSGELSTGSTTIIGSGTVIKGDIKSYGDIRIDGVLTGNLFENQKFLLDPKALLKVISMANRPMYWGK